MSNADFMRPHPLLVFCALTLLPLGASAGALPLNPNTGLYVLTIHVGKADIKSEVAVTPQEDAQGLMFRHSLGDNSGMIFFLQGPQTAQFWMKNCFIPLSVAFIGKDGTILEIHDMQPPPPGIPDEQEPLTRSDSDQVYYALEANLHWFSLNGVKPGDKITPILDKIKANAQAWELEKNITP